MISFLIFLITLISVTAFMPWVGRSYWYSLKLLSRYPWHASCVVTWTIPTSCSQFKTRVINQMNAWKVGLTTSQFSRQNTSCFVFLFFNNFTSKLRPLILRSLRSWKKKFCFQGEELCPGTSEDCPSLPCGQKCLYNFTSYADQTISGTHQTPKHRLVGR